MAGGSRDSRTEGALLDKKAKRQIRRELGDRAAGRPPGHRSRQEETREEQVP